jgi:hypothetical protein
VQNAVFWDVEPCRSCVNRRFGGTYRLHLQGRKIRKLETSLSRWLQTEQSAIHSSETSVHTSSTRPHIPEDGILHLVSLLMIYLLTKFTFLVNSSSKDYKIN